MPVPRTVAERLISLTRSVSSALARAGAPTAGALLLGSLGRRAGGRRRKADLLAEAA